MELFSLKGQTAVVTGVSRGLGRAMALALAGAGADIIGIGLHSMAEIGREITALGVRFTPVHADFTNPESAVAAAKEALKAAPRIEILVNNAGLTPIHPAEEYPATDFDLAMNVNVKALFLLTQEIGRQMIQNRYGRIINVCSVQSMKGGQLVSAYVASKHAVAGLTRAFANEWGKYGVTVNGIAPGYMVTDNTARLRTQTQAAASITAQIPAGRWGQPEDLMGPVVFLASESSRYVNGHLLVADGGYLNN